MIIALGVTEEGRKVLLGFIQAGTENAATEFQLEMGLTLSLVSYNLTARNIH